MVVMMAGSEDGGALGGHSTTGRLRRLFVYGLVLVFGYNLLLRFFQNATQPPHALLRERNKSSAPTETAAPTPLQPLPSNDSTGAKNNAPVHSIRPYREVRAMYQASEAKLKELIRRAWSDNKLPPRKQGCQLTLSEFLDHAHHGSIRWDRAASLATFIDMCRPKKLLEIGSFLGFSSLFYLQLLRAWNGTVTSIDPDIEHRCFPQPRWFYRHLMHRASEQGRVRTVDAFWQSVGGPHYQALAKERAREGGDGVDTVSPSYFAELGESFDMAFIDGDHDLSSVLRDFYGVVSIMRPGSCVIFDDVDAEVWPGTYKALQKLKQELHNNQTGTVLFGDQVALFIDRGFVSSRHALHD